MGLEAERQGQTCQWNVFKCEDFTDFSPVDWQTIEPVDWQNSAIDFPELYDELYELYELYEMMNYMN